MKRGEYTFLTGMILMLVGPWVGGGVGNLLHPAAVGLCIMGILLILGAGLNTG